MDVTYRRLWLFSAPRQLGAYYYISTYIITVIRPGLLSACALNRECEKWRSERETEHCHCYGPSNVRRLCRPREPNKKELGTCPTIIPSALSKATAFRSWGFPASRRTCTISHVPGDNFPLKIWWPRITLSWRNIESSDTGALVISVLVVCSTFTIRTIDRSRVLPHTGRGYNIATR